MFPWTIAHQAILSMRILQARILEQVAMLSSRRSSEPRNRTQVTQIASGFWVTREDPTSIYMASLFIYYLFPGTNIGWRGAGRKGNYLTRLCYLVVFSNRTLLLHYLPRCGLISKNSFPGRQKFIRNLHQKLISMTIELFSSSPLQYSDFLNLFFNWRKISLQCCLGFCCTTAQISHNNTYMSWASSCSPSHPSRSSQSTRLGSHVI